MNIVKKENIELVKFANLSKFDQILHFVSTRKGGESEKPFNELNLGLHVGDDKTLVLQNRKRLSEEIKINQKSFVYLNQVQSNNILIAKKVHKGAGAFDYEQCIKQADAAITTEPGVCLIVLVADCVNILLFDPKRRMVGVVHAGWEGTLNCAAQTTIEKAQQELGCAPKEIIAAIGPSIDPCCYEIGNDVAEEFQRKFPEDAEQIIKNIKGKICLDNKLANKRQLLRAGLSEENIEVSKICSSCEVNRFYSYRKEGITGRFAAGITLKD